MADHMQFAEKGAMKYFRINNGRFERDELVSAAYTGLVVAARKFDPTRGTKFTTLAFVWIDQHLKRVYQQWRRANGWTWQPNAAEKAEGKTGMQHLVRVGQFPVDEDGHELELQSGTPAPESDYDCEVRRVVVMKAARTERERFILNGRLGGDTLEQIGLALGVSRARVQQIEKRLLARVKQRAVAWKQQHGDVGLRVEPES